MWYFELCQVPRDGGRVVQALVRYVAHAMRICVYYSERLVVVLPKAAVVLASFFFVTYIVAVVCWSLAGTLPDPDPLPQCSHLITCFFTLLRLCLYDGDGFDFLAEVMDRGAWALAVLLVVFMCFNTMILLNGLTGIFGKAFSTGLDKEEEGGSTEEENGDIDDDDDEEEYEDEDFDEVKFLRRTNTELFSFVRRVRSKVRLLAEWNHDKIAQSKLPEPASAPVPATAASSAAAPATSPIGALKGPGLGSEGNITSPLGTRSMGRNRLQSRTSSSPSPSTAPIPSLSTSLPPTTGVGTERRRGRGSVGRRVSWGAQDDTGTPENEEDDALPVSSSPVSWATSTSVSWATSVHPFSRSALDPAPLPGALPSAEVGVGGEGGEGGSGGD